MTTAEINTTRNRLFRGEFATELVTATRQRLQAQSRRNRRIIAIGRSVHGQQFQVTAPSLAYSLSMPHVDYSTEGAKRAEAEMLAEGRAAYFDRRGPGSHKMRALGWIEAHHEEQEELAARQEERRQRT